MGGLSAGVWVPKSAARKAEMKDGRRVVWMVESRA